MRTHLEFRSPRFDGGPNSINPDIDGSKLADFLDQRARLAGYDGGVVEEDWGWMVSLGSYPFNLWLGCASHDSSPDWLVFIEPSKPHVRKWLSKIDTREEVEKAAAFLERTLVEHGDATDVRWWSDQDSGRN